jgi:predicted small integral membrane protein
MVIHGFGRAGMDIQATGAAKVFQEVEKRQILCLSYLEKEVCLQVLIGNHHGLWESKTISELNKQGLRVYTRLHDIAWILSAMADYYSNRNLQI